MKSYFKKVFDRITDDIKKYWIVIISFLTLFILSRHISKPSCPMILITGFPCPGCGMTRAVVSLIKLDFAKAFELNPISFVIVILAASFFFFRYFVGKTPKIFSVLLVIIGVLLLFRYIYGMIKWFPNRIPYVYNEKNLLHFITHFH